MDHIIAYSHGQRIGRIAD